MLASFTESQKIEPIHITLFHRYLTQMQCLNFCDRQPRSVEREEDQTWEFFTIQLFTRMSKRLAVSGVLEGRRRTTSCFPRCSTCGASCKGIVHVVTYFLRSFSVLFFQSEEIAGTHSADRKFSRWAILFPYVCSFPRSIDRLQYSPTPETPGNKPNWSAQAMRITDSRLN